MQTVVGKSKVSEEKVRRFLKELRAVTGAQYGWYHQQPGDTRLPSAQPMYTRGKYSAKYVRSHGVNCTGLGNQALRRMGLPIPEVRDNQWWMGGTPEWFDALKDRRKIAEAEIERGFPVGTALVADFKHDFDQGHIVWVSTEMKNDRQMTIGSDDAECNGNPGITERRTVKEVIGAFGLTHAGETPGIGVIPLKDGKSDDPDGHVSESNGHGRDPDREAAGSFDVVDLREAMPMLLLTKAQNYYPHLVVAMCEAKITTYPRACHFLAQLGHESNDLLDMEERGGHRYFTENYENRPGLGNNRPGDGARYHCRGPIQLTGHANYREAGRDLGIDLEGNPEMAADSDVACRIAARYWTSRNINRYADLGRGRR